MNDAIEIKLLSQDKYQDWNDYVTAKEDGTFFHLAQWQQVIEKAFGHKTYMYYACSGGASGERIVGVLPLAHVKSMLFGNNLVSMPFTVYGGALADSDEIRKKLEQQACELARQLNVDSLELRERKINNPDWPTKELYVTFRKEISADDEENMKAIPRKQRAMVRKGIKAELVSEVDENIDRFFDAYSHSVWRLGTPVFSKKYFQILKDTFKEQCDIVTITKDDEVVASVMNFYFRDEVLPYYGGGKDSARGLAGNDFMYWEVMRRAVKKGCKIFDFGRSKEGTGAYSFKKNWGFTPEPLPYQYYLVKADKMPEINPNNPKYKFFIDTWKKMPLGVSRFIGPMISKNLG
ncbi:MAG: FemAB family PEP-CTERM system-associated protein [Gammaproteobacteria bacterium]|nr:MAG: FemAB family PEP-CTERM system-associated protein [Gammaproteobacteria bacterium]